MTSASSPPAGVGRRPGGWVPAPGRPRPWPARSRRGRLGAGPLLWPALPRCPALAAPKFPPLTGRVVDDANLLSPAPNKADRRAAGLSRRPGRQLVVATLPDLQGYEIEDYGYQLLRTWAIGQKGANDGAILIVAPNQKKVRIEVGYGLEPVLTDALSSLIIQRKILPAFKAGRFEQGVVDGTEAVAAQIGLPEDEAKAAVAAAAQPQVRIEHADGGGTGVPMIFVVIIVFWVLSGVLRMFGARRRFGGTGLWWLLPLILSNSGRGGGGGWSGGGSGGGGVLGGGGTGRGSGARKLVTGSW